MVYKVSAYDVMIALMFCAVDVDDDDFENCNICVNDEGTIRISDPILALGPKYRAFASLSHYEEFIGCEETMPCKGDPDTIETAVVRSRIDEVMAAESFGINIEVVD